MRNGDEIVATSNLYCFHKNDVYSTSIRPIISRWVPSFLLSCRYTAQLFPCSCARSREKFVLCMDSPRRANFPLVLSSYFRRVAGEGAGARWRWRWAGGQVGRWAFMFIDSVLRVLSTAVAGPPGHGHAERTSRGQREEREKLPSHPPGARSATLQGRTRTQLTA